MSFLFGSNLRCHVSDVKILQRTMTSRSTEATSGGSEKVVSVWISNPPIILKALKLHWEGWKDRHFAFWPNVFESVEKIWNKYFHQVQFMERFANSYLNSFKKSNILVLKILIFFVNFCSRLSSSSICGPVCQSKLNSFGIQFQLGGDSGPYWISRVRRYWWPWWKLPSELTDKYEMFQKNSELSDTHDNDLQNDQIWIPEFRISRKTWNTFISLCPYILKTRFFENLKSKCIIWRGAHSSNFPKYAMYLKRSFKNVNVLQNINRYIFGV